MDTKWGKTWKKDWINGGPNKWGGAGLDKDIVNIKENSINYINYNPKLLQTVYELSVKDTGMTGNYLSLDSSCKNKQLAISPIPICMLNREIITPTHTTLIYKWVLTIEARKEYIFPGLKKSLLLFGKFYDYGFQAIYYDKTVIILNKGSG